MRKRNLVFLLIVLVGGCLVCLAGALAYQFPPIQERLVWRVENLTAQVRRMIHPPEQVIFVPVGTGQVGVGPTSTEAAQLAPPVVTALPAATLSLTVDAPTVTSTLTPVPTITSTPLPGNCVACRGDPRVSTV